MNENFKEPKLLGKMAERIVPGMEDEAGQFTGWVSHYLIEISFAAVYQ